MNLDDKIKALAARRAEILAKQQAAHQRVLAVQRALQPAIGERDRLQQVCTHFEATGEPSPPYAELGKAALTADRLAHDLIDAEAEAKKADQEVSESLAQLERDEAGARREQATAKFRAAVARYENAIQGSRIAHLSKAVREAASAAGIRLEPRNPLLDEEHVTLGGYPLNIWAHSNLSGASVLANITGNEETKEAAQ